MAEGEGFVPFKTNNYQTPEEMQVLTSPGPVFVNISGVDSEPLWVQPHEVAAIGVYGDKNTLVVLRSSGKELSARNITPSEVAQLLADSSSTD